MLGGEDAAGGDAELGEAAADPHEGAFAGIEVVVHLSICGRLGKGLVTVQVAGVEAGCGGDLDGVEPGEPRVLGVPELGSGPEVRLLGLGGAEEGGDGGPGFFCPGLDRGDERGRVDQDRLSASVAAGEAVLNLLVARADHGHPRHRPAHPPRSSGQIRSSLRIVSSRSDDTLVL